MDRYEAGSAILGPEDLEKHAAEIAKYHEVKRNNRFPNRLVARLNNNYKFILEVYKNLTGDAEGTLAAPPTAEWLLDNFYVIEEQVKDIRVNLTKKYYSRLPVLNSGYLKGYPRVYALARELVLHSDGMIDEKTLVNFIKAYQTKTLLSMGELWALAMMVRIALIGNIRSICEKLFLSFKQWQKAEEVAALMAGSPDRGEAEILHLLREQTRELDLTAGSFIEHLLQQLRKQGLRTGAIIRYLDERLAAYDTSAEEMAEREHQLQAALQVSMGNSITSLRLVAAMDWNEIFESLCQVEQILWQDPAGVYSQMDFESRDNYRHQVEKIARSYQTSEILVARKAIEAAGEALQGARAASGGVDGPATHVGYYLIGKGRKELEGRLGGRPGLQVTLGAIKKHPQALYFGSLALVTMAITAFFISYGARSQGELTLATAFLTGLVVLLPASELAVAAVNFLASRLYTPAVLPKLELKWGIPEELSAMVIVPTLLPNAKRVRQLLEQMEICYLANKEKNLYFALVGDFKDAPEQEMPGDQEIIETALQGIRRLNERYASGDAGPKEIFYYFHRVRRYNEKQGKWMGWERKRGAIIEVNDLLRGAPDTGFTVASCNLDRIPRVRYVITLDADTSLPLGAAKRLIGTLAHPLNRAVLDPRKGVVVEGYGLLQPRIGISLTSANSTLFTRIFAGQGGIDPYTTAVSDVYQDLFGEGIFTGKGIYEIDVFQKVLKNAIPENAVLSHDLLEGSYIRAGLVTDIELVDGYPAKYNAFAMRLHRWVRGDWQLLPWLGARVRDREGRWVPNPLSPLSRWKIFDNLRRSLLDPALLALIILGISWLPGRSLVWLGLALTTLAFPVLLYLVTVSLAQHRQPLMGHKNSAIQRGFKAGLYQALLHLAFLPYQAYLMLDAILRSLVRVLVTRRNLLEWVPAADMEASLKNDLAGFLKRMWVAPLTGVAAFALAIFFSPGDTLPAALLMAFWAAAPALAYRVSRPYARKQAALGPGEVGELRRLARKTWRYFEDMVTAGDNFLPPDNFQEDPPNGIAHRTSPTNIGLFLVSIVAARDLGYISTGEMYRRLNQTLSTIEKMEKWEGHLYNWYDTTTLEVLRPRYVSTVDSGNLVGYLMVVEEALKEYLHKPPVDPSLALGLRDTVQLFNEDLRDTGFALGTGALEDFIAADATDPEAWRKLLTELRAQLVQEDFLPQVKGSPWGGKLLTMIDSFLEELADSRADAQRVRLHEELVGKINKLIRETRFAPLFDPQRQLFSIGYNEEEGRLTKSYYDLLASEARQASYIAIARGEVDKKHWFRLGRKLTMVNGSKGLVSWTGTMFEYLMPLLIMRNFENSLLDETYAFVVKAQKKYGRKRKIPWGTSESAYFAFDINLNYQYKAFGVPELGLKRGLANDMVVAPYATILALLVDPAGAVANLRKLKKEGLDGTYGLYEAIDYTPSRLPRGKNSCIIKNFMAHHQGMSLLALTNCLKDNIMQERFHANPMIRGAELLLQERLPARTIITKEYKDDFVPVRKVAREEDGGAIRKYGLPGRELPRMHLLSNGAYSLMITDGGSGYSKSGEMAVARWRENLRGGSAGFFIYIQNINANNVWSATYEPYQTVPEKYSVIFSPDKAEFKRKDGNIETHLEVIVSTEENSEIRKVSLTNHSEHIRVVEVTSYLEAVLTHPDADLAHPAFSNLFVTTEYVPEYDCLLAARRPRQAGQKPVWAVHSVTVEGEVIGSTQYETDRAKFIGRNRDLSNPLAMDVDQPLSNTAGAVLDPVLSLRKRVRIPPGKTVRLSYLLSVAASRQEVLAVAEKYRDPKAIERAFELSWNRSQIEAGYLGLRAREEELYLEMVPSLLFPSPARRKWEKQIMGNRKGQAGLWPFGISGDLPLVLVRISDTDQGEMVYRLLKAHEFWKIKGLRVDLVFLLEDETSYTQPLQDLVRDAVAASHARELLGRSGGVFILNAGMLAEEDQNLLFAAARIILRGDGGPLEEQLAWERRLEPGPRPVPPVARRESVPRAPAETLPTVLFDPSGLEFYNGLGGFTGDGKEYVIFLKQGQHTPAPWINVIANPRFGFNLSEAGAGYTWAENSRENKLTPWYNDPVADPPGEVFYLRDEEGGDYWSITPLPIREKADYLIRHGRGYTSFEQISHGIRQELTEFVSLEEPVKISLITLENLSRDSRRLAVTYYLRPVLGVHEKATAQHITTRAYGEKGILLITNPYNADFPGRIAFVDTSERERSLTGDRTEFTGINNSLRNPAALTRECLSGTVGAGLDPCGAMQVKVKLEPGEKKEIVFLLGQGRDLDEVLQITAKFSKVEQAKAELARVRTFWTEKLEAIQVATPDKAMDFLLNGWLLYQVIACRLWSRAAFYQSGGAYGFRDQLQDVMAVAYTWPELTRRQILLHAAHQFLEGDVQHWWHPGADKGIRTRYSDDFLWLPYVTADYIRCTEDWGILDEVVPYLEDDPLPEGEDERYNIPRWSEQKGNLYDHCVRAVDNALRFGEHGIPLMGSGDWNDGMNTVGNQGRGESIWLGWFLYTVLQRFIPLCRARQDEARADRYGAVAEEIIQALEKHGWDGSWYRRAYFDDGTPLGSAANRECKIDAIAQSWSVISEAGRPNRAEEAMQAVENYLVDREAGIIKLLTPPFHESELEPGYIKGYVPGVRENGGQYTHAAIWTILAFAKLGKGDKAGELFQLVNPINHARTPMECARYKVEPYVVAADVYAVPPHAGRGGWTWYTGAAGWMYRLGIEHLLGLQKKGDTLAFDPCIPKSWSEYKIKYRFGKTLYHIYVTNPERVNRGIKRVSLDDDVLPGGIVKLVDDGREHLVEVVMGADSNLPSAPPGAWQPEPERSPISPAW